jgi:DNA polymerase-1
MADKKTLVVLDGMAYAFRAFYAVPELSNSRGEPTNAIYGFANALRRAEKQFKPDAAIVAYDSPGGSFRDEMLKEYKGHRDAPPEALVSQFPLIEELAAGMGWTLIKQARMEADDIMATLCKLGHKAGWEVVLMTSDKDILQLCGPGVRVYRENPKGATLYGPPEVKERYGIGPEQITDLLGLMGDSADNIPGVPGVGEKTAAKLLQEYGSMEKALKAAPKMKPGKLMENLQQFAEQARLSKKLAELKDDVELKGGLKDFAYKGPDYAKLLPWLKHYELKGLFAEYSKAAAGAGIDAAAVAAAGVPAAKGKGKGKAAAPAPEPKAPAKGPKLTVLPAQPDAPALKRAGLDLGEPVGLALHPPAQSGGALVQRIGLAQGKLRVLAPVKDLAGLRAALAPLKAISVYESKPLQRILMEGGLEPLEGVLDLSVGGWLLNSVREPRDLGEAASALGLNLDLPNLQADLFQVADEDLAATAAAAEAVGQRMRAKLKADKMLALYEDLEAPLIPVLAGMERDGIKVDVKVLDGLEKDGQAEMKALAKKAFKAAGREFNLNSPSQLAEVLFDELDLPVQKKTKSGPSTDSDVLEALSEMHELPGLMLEYRLLNKLSGTYLQALPRLVAADGRIHSHWNQNGTATGRINSTDPNLQNIPIRTELGKKIRKAFVPEKKGDLILACDYSQIELRILAHYCGDAVLKKAFQTGRDIHTETSARMFNVAPDKVTSEMRSRAKVINFGVLYGMGPFRISREFGTSVKEAKAFLDDYFGQFPKVRQFLEDCKERCRADGYAETLMKRRRPIPEINSQNRVLREAGERVSTNMPIQGTAADMIKLAMLRVDELLKKKKARTRMLLQVHDELVFELAKEEADTLPKLIQKAMEGALPLDVPIEVGMGTGKSWAEAKG